MGLFTGKCLNILCAHRRTEQESKALINQNPLGHINRDKTGLRMVKKGCKVDYHGMAFIVQRVRKGVAYGQTLLQKQYFYAPTNSVKVIG